MFDPFRDFEQRGYLRNHAGGKDPDIVRHTMHASFRRNLPEAMQFLSLLLSAIRQISSEISPRQPGYSG